VRSTYSITSSARPVNESGTAMPRAPAGLQIDCHLHLGDLDHREVPGHFALENPGAISRSLNVWFDHAIPIAQETAEGEFARLIHGGNTVAASECWPGRLNARLERYCIAERSGTGEDRPRMGTPNANVTISFPRF
jgi:hypothetical protein